MRQRTRGGEFFARSFPILLGVALLVGSTGFARGWRHEPESDARESFGLRLHPAAGDQLKKTATKGYAIGTVLAVYGIPESVPDGFVPCDGKWVKQTEFPKLFALTKPGMSADQMDETRFRLPDFRGLSIEKGEAPPGTVAALEDQVKFARLPPGKSEQRLPDGDTVYSITWIIRAE